MYHTVDFLYRDLFHFQAFGFPISSFTFLEHQIPAITFKFKNCFATETSSTPHQKTRLRSEIWLAWWSESHQRASAQTNILSIKANTRIGTWNIRTLHKARKAVQMANEIEHQGTWSNWSKMEFKRTSSNSIRRNHHIPWTWELGSCTHSMACICSHQKHQKRW